MRTVAITAAFLAGLSGTTLAQGTSSGASSGTGAIYGQNWNMGQDLSNAHNTAPQPGTLAADRARRAERQRQLGRNFSGTGHPTNLPQPSPPGR